MIGFAECEFRIYNAQSLKDKRSVVKRILTRTKQKYNVSIAEVGHQDIWQRAGIAIVTVASARRRAERELEETIDFLDSFPEWERIGSTHYEWL
ncbi:MAG TPA: DUF503 domain-containing protein [Bacillus bacterium]|uniref:DUF503 domain-containing protein n=1 Tax=Siminovitchia fordii TaxID=254759 RepID=A0ABQ4JZC9_9BACI|nr:DUF503 family protein [Siminovitchia fordii]GIN18907.1 hypothetical protein J1TS3_00410 [Siminovitchia fordii]HBZ10478.1 DUF503 domain-containing protein [Bacillus sp. (in: firmicutes)]